MQVLLKKPKSRNRELFGFLHLGPIVLTCPTFGLLSSIPGAFLRTFTLRDPFLIAFDRLNLTTSVPVDAPEALLSGTCSASL